MGGTGRGLVLGGGGVTGVAWEIGMVQGLLDLGVDLRSADVVVGTSAGSVVGAQLTSGRPVEELYATQSAPPVSGEIPATIGPRLLLRWLFHLTRPGAPERGRASLGRASLRASTVPPEERLRVISARLPRHEWPETRLLVTAADALTGEFVVFDKDAGVELVDAVAASCAVPIIWPPATVNGRRYIDGGVRSPVNADLVTGCDRVVVLAPQTAALRRADRLDAQLARLGPDVRTVVVTTDAAARQASGRNPLDPARRAAAAAAGRAQAAAVADRVREVWG